MGSIRVQVNLQPCGRPSTLMVPINHDLQGLGSVGHSVNPQSLYFRCQARPRAVPDIVLHPVADLVCVSTQPPEGTGHLLRARVEEGGVVSKSMYTSRH